MISPTLSTVPRLITANSGSTQEIERHIPGLQDIRRQLNSSPTPYNETSIGDFTSCAIILNNELFGDRPEALEDIHQDFISATNPGRSNRLKSDQLQIYKAADIE